MSKIVMIGILALMVCPQLQAAYMIQPQIGGADSVWAAPGDTLDVDILLTSDTADQHISAIFSVIFSKPGLEYLDYTWYSPYPNATNNDDSSPLNSALPLILDSATLARLGDPADVVDVELSNITSNGGGSRPVPFGQGMTATISLRIPDDYPTPSQIDIDVMADTFSMGIVGNELILVDVQSGPSATIHIIPEPASFFILFCGLVLLRK